MKKAEQFFEDYFTKENYKAQDIKYDICMVISYAREEAIRETVKRCAESARIKLVTTTIDDNIDGNGTPLLASKPLIDKDSILKVETEMIKEL